MPGFSDSSRQSHCICWPESQSRDAENFVRFTLFFIFFLFFVIHYCCCCCSCALLLLSPWQVRCLSLLFVAHCFSHTGVYVCVCVLLNAHVVYFHLISFPHTTTTQQLNKKKQIKKKNNNNRSSNEDKTTLVFISTLGSHALHLKCSFWLSFCAFCVLQFFFVLSYLLLCPLGSGALRCLPAAAANNKKKEKSEKFQALRAITLINSSLSTTAEAEAAALGCLPSTSMCVCVCLIHKGNDNENAQRQRKCRANLLSFVVVLVFMAPSYS